MRRRRFLAWTVAVGATALAAGPTLLQVRSVGAQTTDQSALAVADPQVAAQPVSSLPGSTLPIPPLLSPPLANGVRTFNLTLQSGQVEFEPGRPANTLGINAPYLGPTLRATQGDTVAFNILNQIGEPTTLHWHGMLLPAAMDGGPHQEIAPDTMWQPQFDIRQQAATLWYHSHEMEQTRAQVTRGLASMFIIEDNNPAQAALPHTMASTTSL
jgi:FtsP/CotA-like multicopper oxidase with cupredoxin domain